MKRFQLALILRTLLFMVLLSATSIQAQQPTPLKIDPQLIEQLRQVTGGEARISFDEHIGTVRFIATVKERPINHAAGITAKTKPELAAREFLRVYGQLFGLKDQSQEMHVMRTQNSDQGRTHVRFQQKHKGVPVFAGELIINMDTDKNVLSASGEVLPYLNIDVVPTIDASTASQHALELVMKQYGLHANQLTTTQPQLWIYEPELVGAPSQNSSLLVWRLEVRSSNLEPIRELVLVDAHHDDIVLHFNQIESALNRQTYTAENAKSLPGTLVCDEVNPTCGGGDSHAVSAHRYAGDTYNFYRNHHNRDSIDNAGMALVSTVHYYRNYSNAFWNGSQMVYGDGAGFPLADDVVAHELTHGVTQRESGLLYINESGAINESLSDIWGEFVDLTNGAGDDSNAVRWQVGEDITGLGTIRNMQDPTLFGDPDRMSSPNYYHGTDDDGGVHTNSGVNNKSAYLMVDGGTFNGVTVTGIGIDKVSAIYYEAQTNLLTSGSNYHNLADALPQACFQIVGIAGITIADCTQVENAVWATEMRGIYVATTGNDVNNCLTYDSPCRTIRGAIEKAISGTVIHIAPGIYNERLIITKKVKLVGHNVIIR